MEHFQNCNPKHSKCIAVRTLSVYKSIIPKCDEDEHALIDDIMLLLEEKTGISVAKRSFCGYRGDHDWSTANEGNEFESDVIVLQTNYKCFNVMLL